jgi:hypothetical protein|tara:strand:- start:4160 stop:4261 length:102 start_codon:yes stop_codon:yes gene_type:complete
VQGLSLPTRKELQTSDSFQKEIEELEKDEKANA